MALARGTHRENRSKDARNRHHRRSSISTAPGKADIETPLPFLSHMVDQIARHGLIDLTVRADGDVEIDGHHTTEDLGIVLGQAVLQAIGDKVGHRSLWLGDACRWTKRWSPRAIDLSGRPFFVWRGAAAEGEARHVGRRACADLLRSVRAHGACATCTCGLHEGENLHHIVEISFKAFAKALAQATRIDPRIAGVPSTKGAL